MSSAYPRSRPKMVVVVGPTGAGKSDLGLALAARCHGEVVSADSQQVYRGMDIGTGKVSASERETVPHHLIDVLDPDQQMTAADFVAMADAAIADIAGRGRPVIVVGGTGLYVRALLLGLFDGPPADEAFRQRLSARAAVEGVRSLWEELAEVDPPSSLRIDPNDLIRITRALEIFALSGETMTTHLARHDHTKVEPRYPALLVGIAPPREALYARIDARVDEMLAAGWLDEVRSLRAKGYLPPLRSQAAIGYSELHGYLDQTLAWDEAVRLTKRNSRHYARRQANWYKGDERVRWAQGASDVDLGSLEGYLMASGT